MSILQHTQVLRELPDVIARPLLIIQGEDAEDWRKANVTPTFKKVREENPGNYMVVSLFSGPTEVVKQINLEPVSKHMKVKKVLASSQHQFMNRQ